MYVVPIGSREYEFDIDPADYRSIKAEIRCARDGTPSDVVLVCKHHEGMVYLFTQPYYRIRYDDGTVGEVCGG